MDITKYDNSIRRLYDEYQTLRQTEDARCMQILKQMRKQAQILKDDALLGYVHYSMASIDYFSNGSYDSFLKNLRIAAECIIRTGDETEMKNVYYLIALDALSKGMYDVSFNYFMYARNVAEEAGLTGEAAILNESLGFGLLHLGAYEASRKYTRESLRGIRQMKMHPHYHYNIVSGYLNDANATLCMGQLKQAQTIYEKASRFAKQHQDRLQADVQFDLAMLDIRLALSNGDKKRFKNRMSDLLKQAKDVGQFVDHMEEVRLMCAQMLENGAYDEVGAILRVIEGKSISDDATNARRIFVDLKVDYYTATGKKKALAAAYLEQDEVYARQRAEQKNTYRYVEDLIRLTGELHREQERLRAAHEELLKRAVTDALTDIPNRYALNRKLEEAFERAYQEQAPLGVSVMDVDSLKAYNDAYGHQAGDRLLTKVGRALKHAAADARIFVARYGGDEFVLIFEDMTRAEALDCMARLKREIETDFSYGLCYAVPAVKNKSWDYLARADKALYREKRKRDQARSSG